jgi:aspartyl-tRNA(Asn)/glutamyl-tRNA(Gln) amidotransferase subunit A
MDAISAHDPLDATSHRGEYPDYSAAVRGASLEGRRIGVPAEYFIKGMDAETERLVRGGIARMESAGARAVEITLPHTEYAVAVYYVVATAEASSNLARYDGVHYGHRTKEADSLVPLYSRTRREGFGAEVKRRIMLGTYVLSSGYYDAYYLRALKVRSLVKRDFDEAFRNVDFVVCPTSPTPAFKAGEKTADPLSMYLSDIFTISANLAGVPGISVPCGFTSAGLPVGMQIIGRPFDDAGVLAAAAVLERTRSFTDRWPPL